MFVSFFLSSIMDAYETDRFHIQDLLQHGALLPGSILDPLGYGRQRPGVAEANLVHTQGLHFVFPAEDHSGESHGILDAFFLTRRSSACANPTELTHKLVKAAFRIARIHSPPKKSAISHLKFRPGFERVCCHVNLELL